MSRHTRHREGLGRRKACDNCCRRKVRCDGKTPSCSTCTLRQLDCTWTPDVTAPKSSTSNQTDLFNELRFGNLEDRLTTIEARLQPPLWPVDVEQLPSSGWAWTDESTPIESLPSSLDYSSTSLGSHASFSISQTSRSTSSTYDLPDWDMVEDLVGKYFQGPNQALPIFDGASFLRMLYNWRHKPQERDKASWASINAVLALSAHYTGGVGSKELVRDSLNRAQSVLNDLVTRDEDLKGIQVILSLVSLFLNTPHPEPTCILIATAVKLAHRLGLHDREARGTVDAELALQMDRLFRITYIYDRDISLRAVEPYAQHEDDYDTPLLSSDVAGTVCVNGIQINWLQLRTQLARIQGLAYSTTFSVKARRIPPDQKQLSAKHIDGLVQSWQDCIPAKLHAEQLLKEAGEVSDSHARLIGLHLTAYHARFMAHRVYARNPDWIRHLTDYSDRFTKPSTDELHDHPSPQLLAPDWAEFLYMARICIRLIQMIDANTSAMIWSMLCTYQTALIVLIANRLTIWEHNLSDQMDSDVKLIGDAMQRLQDLIERQGGEEPVTILLNVHQACSELNRRADIACQLRVCDSV